MKRQHHDSGSKSEPGDPPAKRIKQENDHSSGSSVAVPHAELLHSGVIIIRGFLSAPQQQQLLQEALELGNSTNGGFYDCHNEKTKHMRMMNLGRKVDSGKSHKLPIPASWARLARAASELATAACASVPALEPDICVANLYTARSRLSLHQDIFTRSSRKVPVVSFSIGASAEFIYKRKWKAKQLLRVTLRSGDAFIFGGKSRGIIHGVSSIGDAKTVPPALSSRMPPQSRLNLNFRQF